MAGQDQTEAHWESVRRLSGPGGPLGADAETASIRNPAWFVSGEPTAARRQFHGELVDKAFAAATAAIEGKEAVVLAGPPGAGKSTVLGTLLGAEASRYLRIDADEFKVELLKAAIEDGSYDSFLVPEEVRDLVAQGERFFPLELAALVHEESSMVAQRLRREALRAGLNVVIDTVLSDPAKAVLLGEQLEAAGYTVRVIDVETTREVSDARVKARWRAAYEAAKAGRPGLGGRWVPSEYARALFPDISGRSTCATAARRLADTCGRVLRYQLFEVDAADAEPRLAAHMRGAAVGDPLVTVAETVPLPGRTLGDDPPEREGG
jgi:predicted kinase